MDNVRLLKIIIIIVVFCGVLGFFGYYFFKRDQAPAFSSEVVRGADDKGKKIIDALNEIRDIKISAEVFEDPVFKDLLDFSVPVRTEEIQRPNPFAPIGVGGGSNRSPVAPLEEE